MYRLLLLLLISLFVACNENIINKNTTEVIFNEEEYVNTYLFDNIDSVVIIGLQDIGINETCIGRIDKIEVTDSLILCLDKETAVLTIFRNDGKYKTSISHLGRGVGEFITIDDFIIADDYIYILDYMQNKMVVFDTYGNFIKEIPLTFNPAYMTKISDSTFLFINELCDVPATGGPFRISHSPNFKYYKELPIKFNDVVMNNGFAGLHKYYSEGIDGDILYKPTFTYSVYGISVDSCYLKYDYDFGKYSATEKHQEYSDIDELMKLFSSKIAWNMDYFQETNQFAYFIITIGDDVYQQIHIKKDEKCYANKYLSSDLLCFRKTPIKMVENKVYTVIPASIIEEEKLKPNRPYQYKIIDYPYIDSDISSANPYIAITYFSVTPR